VSAAPRRPPLAISAALINTSMLLGCRGGSVDSLSRGVFIVGLSFGLLLRMCKKLLVFLKRRNILDDISEAERTWNG
jgi:hypothetical protein